MRITIILILFLLSIPLFAQKSQQRVLFVGNSYTYFWNLPKHVELMAQSKDIDLEVRQSTAGGVNWGQHWRGEKGLRTKELIKSGDFDFVILQNHSLSTINRLDSMMIFGAKLAELIKESGAKPILYQTWAREWNPLMLDQIRDGYRKVGESIGAEVVPIGELWQKVNMYRPDLNLYDEDGSHPNALGTYLTACGFFKALTGQKSEGAPRRLSEKNKYEETIYYNFVSEQTALFLQDLVDQSSKVSNLISE
jgi:hypothetical protein